MKFKDTVKEILVEQKWYEAVKDSLIAASSPIVASVIFLNKALQLYRGANFKKIRLIFPKADWELTAVTFLQKLGVVTGVYSSLEEANTYLSELAKKGVKTDELVIGSHGREGQLLSTRESPYEYHFNNTFLDSFKPIIQPSTKVFFTACEGADDLLALKDAAEKLGVTVYGSSGIYNYITNSSAKGYYWCSSNAYSADSGKDIPPFEFSESNCNIYKITLPMPISEVEGNISATMTVKDGVFPVKFNNPIKLEITDLEYDDLDKSPYGEKNITRFNLQWLDSAMFRSNTNFYEAWINKLKAAGVTSSGYDFLEEYIKKGIKKGTIKINISVKGKSFDLLSLKPVSGTSKADNEFLLKNKLCGKMQKAPISWL